MRGRDNPNPPSPPAHAVSHPQRVLIVEDEPALLRALRINLRARGYEVTTAKTSRAALTEAARRPPDAVLLDLGLPDVDGVRVIGELRTWSRAPVIVLSGRTGSGDKIGALDAGADDYVTKPFSMEELLARLHALLQRDAQRSGRQEFTIGHCTIDPVAHTVRRQTDKGTEAVRLTATEWRMLEVLLRSPGQLVPAGRLLSQLWGPGTESSIAKRFSTSRAIAARNDPAELHFSTTDFSTSSRCG